MTDYINDNKYGFSLAQANSLIVLDASTDPKAASALASCAAGLFRPDNELWLQVIVTRHGWNAHWDGYALSMVRATFGDENEHQHQTDWTYHTSSPVFCDGCNRGYSSWFQLKN